MKTTAVIESTNQGFHLSGDLDFSTALVLIEKGKEFISDHNTNTVSIDLDSVKRIDSAGIAILLGWKRDCLAAKKNCKYENVPQQTKSLIETYRLGKFLKT